MANATITGISALTAVTLGFPQHSPIVTHIATMGNVVSVRRFSPVSSLTITTLGEPAGDVHLKEVAALVVTTVNEPHLSSGLDNVASLLISTPGSLSSIVRIKTTSALVITTPGTLNRNVRVITIAALVITTPGNIRASAIRITGITRCVITTPNSLTVPRASYSLPEDRRASLGYRPFSSLLVYVVEALSIADVTLVPDGGSFLLSSLFYSGSDTTFYTNGGRPGYVGTKVGSAYFFRPPTPKEIVWFINIDAQGRTAPGDFYLFGQDVWQPFMPFAYRGIVSQLQYVAQQLDPAGAIRYYGQLLGAIGAQLGQDNLDLAAISDPDSTPERFLPVLSDELGVDISEVNSVPEQRRRIRAAVPLHHIKGTMQSAIAAIRQAGFIGYVNELWVNPVASDNWYDPKDAPANVQAFLRAEGLFNLVTADSGLKGTDLIERPHQYANDDPTGGTYFPSSRVAVHINNLDGSPVTVASQATFDRLMRALRTYCFPAHVDIRYFVTDVGGGDPMPIGDSVTFGNNLVRINHPVIAGSGTVASSVAAPASCPLTGTDYPTLHGPNFDIVNGQGDGTVAVQQDPLNPCYWDEDGSADTANYFQAAGLDAVLGWTWDIWDTVSPGFLNHAFYAKSTGLTPVGTYSLDHSRTDPSLIGFVPETINITL